MPQDDYYLKQQTTPRMTRTTLAEVKHSLHLVLWESLSFLSVNWVLVT